jgi:hypothetical protein
VVFGNVADDNGDAVSDVEIIIELPSNNPVIPGYTSTHITDSNGNYTDTIAINNNQSE